MRTVKINVPNPSSEQVEHYLRAWNELEIDKYMWQLGKEYFPKSYGKKKVI